MASAWVEPTCSSGLYRSAVLREPQVVYFLIHADEQGGGSSNGHLNICRGETSRVLSDARGGAAW